MGASLTGDWKKADNIFGAMNPERLKAVQRKALIRMLLYYKRIIVKNIMASGTLVGKPFKKLSDVTIIIKGSSKPLINTGDMVGNITEKLISEVEGFVGLRRGDVHLPSGQNLADIGEIHEWGAIMGESKSGKVTIIPARPFIRPVIESRKHQKEALKIYEETIAKGLGFI